jgi:FtsP/CotA-like multicopper oxidase with cupredoxin domain
MDETQGATTEVRTPFAQRRIGRRSLLRKGAILGAALPTAGGLLVAGCYEDPTGGHYAATPATSGQASAGAATATMTHATDIPASAPSSADMDSMDEAGVKQFLANMATPITKGKGNVPLAFTMDGDTKVFNLTVDEIEWETTPGNMEKARAYNKMVPGPVIRATEGEKVRVIVKNNLPESTAVHWHGLVINNKMDGVPFVTQPPIKPGETFTYEFTLRNSGTHMYHSHHNAMEQTNRGLLGALIVDPKDPASYPAHDAEFIMVLNDTLMGFTINGKGFPATDAVTAKVGQKLLIRYMNEGEMIHPMHLHGMPQKVIAIDGYQLSNPYMCDTVAVAPGNRYDVIVDCTEEGLWAFHCHILSHAESSAGMYGLVTVLVVAA